MDTEFRKALESLINHHSKENESNTPDFILAGYLVDCLWSFDRAVIRREKWYGRTEGILEGVVTTDERGIRHIVPTGENTNGS